jgi:hypothetical protein
VTLFLDKVLRAIQAVASDEDVAESVFSSALVSGPIIVGEN